MMDLIETRDVAPAPSRWFVARQTARLSIGGAGLAGGAFLLAMNVLTTLTTTLESIPWVPFSANLALILGSAMFLREYREAARKARSRGDGR
jgi:hypothetical protein